MLSIQKMNFIPKKYNVSAHQEQKAVNYSSCAQKEYNLETSNSYYARQNVTFCGKMQEVSIEERLKSINNGRCLPSKGDEKLANKIKSRDTELEKTKFDIAEKLIKFSDYFYVNEFCNILSTTKTDNSELEKLRANFLKKVVYYNACCSHYSKEYHEDKDIISIMKNVQSDDLEKEKRWTNYGIRLLELENYDHFNIHYIDKITQSIKSENPKEEEILADFAVYLMENREKIGSCYAVDSIINEVKSENLKTTENKIDFFKFLMDIENSTGKTVSFIDISILNNVFECKKTDDHVIENKRTELAKSIIRRKTPCGGFSVYHIPLNDIFSRTEEKNNEELEKCKLDLAINLANSKDNNGEYRFSDDEIESIMAKADKKSIAKEGKLQVINLTLRLIEEKNPDGTYRFNSSDINTILEIFSKNNKKIEQKIKCVQILLNLKDKDNKQLCNSKEIANLTTAISNNTEIFSELIDNREFNKFLKKEFN